MTDQRKDRDLRVDPLTTRELDTTTPALTYRRLARALELMSMRTDNRLHDRYVAGSQADVYYRIATLFDDLTSIADAARILNEASTLSAIDFQPGRVRHTVDEAIERQRAGRRNQQPA